MGMITSYPSSHGASAAAEFQQDIYDWSGSFPVNSGIYVNMTGFGGLTKREGGTAGVVDPGSILVFPPESGFSQVIFSVRMSGSVSGGGGTPREWKIQMRRGDGATVVGSVSTVKVDGTDISDRDVNIVSYTYGINDPFSVGGIQIGINNVSGQTITITSFSIRIQRVINK